MDKPYLDISEKEWENSQDGELTFWDNYYKKTKGFIPDRIFCYKFIGRYELLLGNTKDKIVVDVGSGPKGGILPTLKCKEKIAIDSLFSKYEFLGWVYSKQDFIPIISAAEKIPLLNDYADIVFCMNALDHMKNPSIAFIEMSRILKHNGRLFLSVNLRKEEDRSKCHKICLNREFLIEMFKENGMKLLHEHIEEIEGHLPAITFVIILEKT